MILTNNPHPIVFLIVILTSFQGASRCWSILSRRRGRGHEFSIGKFVSFETVEEDATSVAASRLAAAAGLGFVAGCNIVTLENARSKAKSTNAATNFIML